MQKIMVGIKPTGDLHLGNYLGCIKQALEIQDKHECFFFIPDLHGLVSVKNAKTMSENTTKLATALIALGLDFENHVFYKQSSIPDVCELTWILSCLTPHGLLERAHAFKDAKNKDKEVNTGLFTYPVLMAADILLYDIDLVPVGKDQLQHIEIARDLGQKFNNTYGETLKLPKAIIEKNVETVIGTDGQKMSKSYNNIIPIFGTEKEIKKSIMGIPTDSKTVEEPKDPKTCNIFKLYSYLAEENEIQELEKKYLEGNFGYGDAKKILLNKFLTFFTEAREKYNHLIEKPEKVSKILEKGAEKARQIAKNNLKIIRKKIGVN